MSKKENLEKVKAILNSYPLNKPIINEFEFLCSVFGNHPSAEIKIGNGIAVITVRKSKFNSRCFYITRRDGSETDISYLQCFNGKPTKRAYVISACRNAIEPIVEKVRLLALEQKEYCCPITGEILVSGNIHIDHYDKTFAELFNEWVADKDIEYLYSKINDHSQDGCVDVWFTDQSIADEFIYFHNGNTHLRAVSRVANLSILRKNTLTDYFKKKNGQST